MSTRAPLHPRAPHWRLGIALLSLLVASTAAAATKPAPAPREIDRCQCGPLDVLFAIDDTGSMGGSLSAFQASFPTLLNQIITSSSNDYQLGLITFKDDVTVVEDFAPNNGAVVGAAINGLGAGGGWGAPEASDEALNTGINNIVGRPNQNGGFTGIWRTGARRVVVLITDNLPGGFNDNYTGNALANAMAQDASNKGIRIHAVYVPTAGTPDATVVGIMQNYATVSQGAYRLTNPDGSDVPQAVQDFMSDCRQPSDVYMKDTAADFGTEPSTGTIYWSPDIKVCNNPSGCASSGNPVYGSPNNYVFVTLRNNGPVRPTGPIGGSLHLYYLPSGGNASWPGSWQLIKVEHGIFLDAGEVRDIRFQWANVPVPGHYCLLARWVSAGDPMTFPEFIGSSTYTNTQRNNNIAWRNIDVIRAVVGGSVGTTYDVRPVPGRITDLLIRPERPFPGKVALDLGDEGMKLWEAGGGRATGVEGKEGTVLYFGRDGGAIHGLRPTREVDVRLHLTFISDGSEDGTFPVHIEDLDVEAKTVTGGVRYEVTLLKPETEPFPAELAAVRNREGLVELTWPHVVHHKAYRVLRSDKPDGRGEEIAAFEAGEARETEAVRFIDAESKGRPFFYSVVSISEGGETISAPATADTRNE